MKAQLESGHGKLVSSKQTDREEGGYSKREFGEMKIRGVCVLGRSSLSLFTIEVGGMATGC